MYYRRHHRYRRNPFWRGNPYYRRNRAAPVAPSPGNYRRPTTAQSKLYLDDLAEEGVTSASHYDALDLDPKERELRKIRFNEAKHYYNEYESGNLKLTYPGEDTEDWGDFEPTSEKAARNYLWQFYDRQCERLKGGDPEQSVTTYPFMPRYQEAVVTLGQDEVDYIRNHVYSLHGCEDDRPAGSAPTGPMYGPRHDPDHPIGPMFGPEPFIGPRHDSMHDQHDHPTHDHPAHDHPAHDHPAHDHPTGPMFGPIQDSKLGPSKYPLTRWEPHYPIARQESVFPDEPQHPSFEWWDTTRPPSVGRPEWDAPLQLPMYPDTPTTSIPPRPSRPIPPFPRRPREWEIDLDLAGLGRARGRIRRSRGESRSEPRAEIVNKFHNFTSSLKKSNIKESTRKILQKSRKIKVKELNSYSADQLVETAGIPPEEAEKIVNYRDGIAELGGTTELRYNPWKRSAGLRRWH